MQTVFQKTNETKNKIERLLLLYKNIKEENKSLKERVIILEGKVTKQQIKKSSEFGKVELRDKIDKSICYIEEVIKILS